MAGRLLASLCVCGTVLFAGCKAKELQPVAAAPAPVMKAAPATPIEEKKEELGGKTWDPQWDVLVEQALAGGHAFACRGEGSAELLPEL